jgi:hypothetical protein
MGIFSSPLHLCSQGSWDPDIFHNLSPCAIYGKAFSNIFKPWAKIFLNLNKVNTNRPGAKSLTLEMQKENPAFKTLCQGGLEYPTFHYTHYKNRV